MSQEHDRFLYGSRTDYRILFVPARIPPHKPRPGITVKAWEAYIRLTENRNFCYIAPTNCSEVYSSL